MIPADSLHERHHGPVGEIADGLEAMADDDMDRVTGQHVAGAGHATRELSKILRGHAEDYNSGATPPAGNVTKVLTDARKYCAGLAQTSVGSPFGERHKSACRFHGKALKDLIVRDLDGDDYETASVGDDQSDALLDNDGDADALRGRRRSWTRADLLVAGNALAALNKRLDRILVPRARVVRLAKDHSVLEGAGAVRSINESARSADFVMTDETGGGSGFDRVGDVVSVQGIELRNFLRSPIALMNHDQSQPIGRWTNVRKVGRKLLGTLVFASTKAAEEAWQLVKAGVLGAVSLGFNPIGRQEPIPESGGMYFTAVDLLECSLVSVPANAGALLVGRSAGPCSCR
jgi:HK97 family phage prohead protease